MTDAEKYTYSAPVAQLLTLGEPEGGEPKEWLNYLELGFTAEDVPELLRLSLAVDELWDEEAETENVEGYAPYHAWRVLGQLRAEAAIEPLLTLFKNWGENEWVMEELPQVYSLLGTAALPALADFIADHSNAEWPRVNASSSIETIGQGSPEARALAVDILSKQLETFHATEYELNGFLIGDLVKLKAKEAAPLIERAFAAEAVDESIVGDWEDVREALDLLSPEELEELHQRKEAERRQREETFDQAMGRETAGPLNIATPSDAYWRQTPRVSVGKKMKQKRKIAKQARKKNRKR
jgi:hypothetical protein